jgi:hypothetical protein
MVTGNWNRLFLIKLIHFVKVFAYITEDYITIVFHQNKNEICPTLSTTS